MQKRNSGITSIYSKDGIILVGAYDGKLIEYDKVYKQKQEHDLGNVWRIVQIEDNLGLSCMYDGVKIIDTNYNIIKTYETKSIAYAIDYNQDRLVFSDYYEMTYYEVCA